MSVKDYHRSRSHESRMGPTMSPRTVTLPRSDPDWRESIGTTRATGRPRLVTTNGSPVSATRSRRARHLALNVEAGMERPEVDMTILYDHIGLIQRPLRFASIRG